MGPDLILWFILRAAIACTAFFVFFGIFFGFVLAIGIFHEIMASMFPWWRN